MILESKTFFCRVILCGMFVSVANVAARETPPRTLHSTSSAKRLSWVRCATGPWGTLDRLRFELDVAESRIPSQLLRPEPTVWNFPSTSAESLLATLRKIGFAESQQKELLSSKTSHWSNAGVRVVPSDAFVLTLDAELRASLYQFLGQSPTNPYQHDPYRFADGELETRLVRAMLPEETKDVIRRLTYQARGDTLFADKDYIMRTLTRPEHRREVIRVLLRFHSYQLRIQLSQDSDVAAIAKYWSVSSAEHLLPLLRSLAAMDTSTSVTELLSPFAKARLHTYPARHPSRPDSGPDCFWTAANFFNDVPDDAFFNPDVVASFVNHQYERVSSPRYGDIAFFVAGGVPQHAAIYVASDLLFTKNGFHYWSPWVLNTAGELRHTYGLRESVEVRYFRGKTAQKSSLAPSLEDLK